MARKKVTPEEEIVNTAVEGTALGSVPADTAPPDETGADSGDFPAELPEGDLPAEETAEQSETLPAMEAAEAKPLGLSTEEKTASQDESDTAEERVKEAELHEEMSEFPDAEENLISDLPTSVPQVSEADEADWGFGEPVPEEAAAEAAEDEYLAAGNSEMLDASDEKSERTLFYELDFNELDRGLSEEERKEWNSIYASFRGRSAITGTIIGVDLYARYLPRSEARMLENKRELCAVVVPYRIPILIRESEMWELGEERPDFVLRNMVGASIDVIVTKVERTANRAQASRRQASRSQRRFFAAREDIHAVGSRITCRMLAVGPRRCLVDCYGYDLDMTQREIRYAAIPDLRTEFHPGSEIDCIVKEYHPRTGELIVSAKETEVNPFFGAEERHPVGSRRFAMISGKYGGGVFCNLPDGVTCMCNYEEIPVPLEMPEDVRTAYKEAEHELQKVLRTDRKAAQKILSTYLNLLTVYPDQPYDQAEVVHPINGMPIVTPKNCGDFSRLLPKEERVLELVRQKAANGERVLIYTSWTRTDSQKKLQKLLCSEGYRTEILTPQIATDKREDWVNKRVKSGLQVLITNPRCVETGLDLNAFTTIIFYSMGYNLFTLRQASRRSWRINQTAPRVEVYMLYYADTMQAKAMKLMASKLAVAGIIEGTFSEEGLAAMSDVKDLTSQMAKELALGIRDNVEDIAAAFRKMAVMNPERKKNITAAQPKETAAEEQKAPSAKDSFGVRTAQAQVRQALYEGLLARTAEEQKKRKSKKAEVDENQLSIFGFAA